MRNSVHQPDIFSKNVKISRNLDNTVFVTLCYVLKKLDVWKDMEQYADDGRTCSTSQQYSRISLRKHRNEDLHWVASPPNSDGYKQYGAKDRK